MVKLFERNSTRLTVSEFYDNYKSGKYNFNVSYQRKSDVWSEDKKSFLIDSILKNYPIPAIFMRPKVDNSTGKTVYDIVDGKQRLEAIIGFIDGRVPLTSYFAEDDFFANGNNSTADKISGLYFTEIKERNKEFTDYIKQFWTYGLNVEYLYEENEELVSSVFDRLNRNGEPLTYQELRNAKYSKSKLLSTIHKLSKDDFWSDKLDRLESVRMEDEEFISELFFLILEDGILESSQSNLDALYDKYQNESEKIDAAVIKFNAVVEFIKGLSINFAKYKRICWTTHLYGLFTFAWYCVKNNINADSVKDKLQSLYKEYFKKGNTYEGILKKYKDSASSRTASQTQRTRRLEALLEYCNIIY